MRLCKICNNLNETKYQHCSDECKKEYHKQKQSEQYEKLKYKATIIKLYLIKLKGGSCIECGYHNNIAGLIFHHKRDKKFSLDMRQLMYKDFSVILEEVEKCDLMCHNCHNELHNPNLTKKD